VKRLPVLQVWLLSFVLCTAAAAISFKHLDIPLAVHFWSAGRLLSPMGEALGAGIVLLLEALVVLVLVITRVVRGHLSPLGEALAIACLSSISTYGINAEVLKPFFGVPDPLAMMAGARHAFHFLMGSARSSFPSGHMVLAGAFAGVFMRLYRASVWPLTALLLIAAALLVVGVWHFVSDVIEGAFVGVSAGLLAGEAWIVHSKGAGW